MIRREGKIIRPLRRGGLLTLCVENIEVVNFGRHSWQSRRGLNNSGKSPSLCIVKQGSMEVGVMAAAGVLLNGIVHTAEAIRRVGDQWYQEDSAWTEFPRQVKCLEEKKKQWDELVTNYGLAKDEALMEFLSEANRRLEEELQKLPKRKNETLSKIHKAVFPSLIGQSINKAIQAFDDVLKELNDQHNLRIAAQRKTLACERMLSFSEHDHRYVPLKKTEQAVKTVLLAKKNNNEQMKKTKTAPLDPNEVILLHGGPGKGKSTLARSLAVQIQSGIGAQTQDEITPASNNVDVQSTGNQGKPRSIRDFIPSVLKKDVRQATDICADGQKSLRDPPNPVVLHQPAESSMIKEGVTTGSGTAQRSESLTFDKVVFLECSTNSARGIVQRETKVVQCELREKLAGWMEDVGEVKDSELQTTLRSLLHDRKVLIILDNVWEPAFLRSMVHLTEGALNVKWLITSQNKNLCDRLNFCPTLIPMEEASLEDARMMFARHIKRLQDGQTIDVIPEQVQYLADELIRKVDRNPLAIACLATGIDPKTINEEKEWKDVRRDYFHLLNSRDTAMIFNVGYPGSYWAAIQFSFERLDEGAKRLLVLIGLCEATSVPQEVLEYLYRIIGQKRECRTFKTAKADLEAKDLVQIRNGKCSIHDLLRTFVNDPEANQEFRKSILIELDMSSLNGVSGSTDPDHEDVLSVIISLYLKGSFEAEKIDLRISIPMDPERRQQRRHELETVMPLLVEDQIEDRTVDWSNRLRQVFLKYIKEDTMEKEKLTLLFKEADFKAKLCILEFLDQSSLDWSDTELSSLLGRRRRTAYFVELIQNEWPRLRSISAQEPPEASTTDHSERLGLHPADRFSCAWICSELHRLARFARIRAS